MKKTISILLIICIITSLSGCEGKKEQTQTKDSEQKQTITSETSTAITIEEIHILSSSKENFYPGDLIFDGGLTESSHQYSLLVNEHLYRDFQISVKDEDVVSMQTHGTGIIQATNLNRGSTSFDIVIGDNIFTFIWSNDGSVPLDNEVQEAVLEQNPVQKKGEKSVEKTVEQVVEAKVEYASVISHSKIPVELGMPAYNKSQIQDMIKNNLSLDDVAAALSTLADVLQYLQLKGFCAGSGDLQFFYSDHSWSVNRSPQVVFNQNIGNCGGGSNLINYLLRDDYDAQGYIHQSSVKGGHVYNWFKVESDYYFFDLQMLLGNFDNGYAPSKANDPKEYSEAFVKRENAYFENKNPDQTITLQYMYTREAPHAPISYDKLDSEGWPCNLVLSEEGQDGFIQLYKEEGYDDVKFFSSVPMSAYPKEARY